MAAVASVSVGWTRYLQLPGSQRVDWSVVGPWVVAFGLCCAMAGALGFGGGMRLASRRDGRRTSALRLALGASLGGALLGTAPAMAGLGGFAHLRTAPFMGVENILIAGLVASASFVAVFAPLFHPQRSLGLARRLSLAAVASVITGATLGGSAWLLMQTLGLVPSFHQIFDAANRLGIWTLSALAGAGLTAALGVFVGLATWIYLSLVMAVRR